ncbi:MAG: hypothetical protein JSW27_17330 [Phycisphaerales bacterium]|nr:MAG: hypothetical protein JSW27_17330 [Phycisphaerales bacterium]
MTRFSGPTRTFVLSALLLMLGLGTAGSDTARADDALKMVPSSSLYCVRINNLDNALGQVELFLTGVFPAPVSMMVKGQLGQVLGSPQPQGLNTAGSFTLFGPLPGPAGPDPTAVGILIPVSDYQQFVSGNPNVSTADATGISTIGPAGSAMLEVTQVGNFALAGKPGSGLAEVKKLLTGGASGLAAGLDAAELKQASSASVWAYANIEAAAQLFGPMVQAKIQEIKQGMAMAQEQGAPQMAAASASIDMYATLIETLMNEAKYLSLSLNPSADRVGAAVVLAGKPGSGLAAMFQAGTAKSGNKLLGYLSNGAVMNFTGSLDSPFWKKYNEMAMGMLSQMVGSGATPDANMDELKTMMTNAMDCFSGSVAGSLSANPSGKPPFSVQYVAGLKDTEKFYQLMDAASKMMNSGPIAEFYKSMGVTVSFDVKRKADTYQGVAIDSVTFSMASTDTTSPQAQMINALYGGGLNVQLATLDGMLVYALSPDAGAAVRKLIDQVKAGGAGQAPSEVQTAMQLIPGADKADFFTTLNVLRIIQMVSAIAPIPIPATGMPSQSNLAIAGGTADGKMTIELAVPKQHVQEIMAVVMQMQQQGMQQ